MTRPPRGGASSIAPLDRFEDLSASELAALAEDFPTFAATGALTPRSALILSSRPLFRAQPVLLQRDF